MKPLIERELKYVRSLMIWIKELEMMLETKQRINKETTNGISVKWFAETCLPKSLDWIV